MKQIYILIHGTWSDHLDNWFMPHGDFFKELQSSIPQTAHIVPFLWSGKNSEPVRHCTAQALAQLIKSYFPENQIHIIGHSHGANIAFITSQLLAQEYQEPIIHSFFALGTPINTTKYAPHPTVIKTGWNLFSTNDMVQPIFGRFCRILTAEWNFYNLRIFFENKEPEHFQLHSPLVARWIADITQNPTYPNMLISRLILEKNQQGILSMETETLFETKSGILNTVSTAIKLAHYKAKSMKRSRQRRKKVQSFT
jgi:pimeloyl-ACP methyl ester carboxylesterase